MGFRLANPTALVGFVAIAFTVALWRNNPWRLPASRRRVILGLRIALLTVLILALSGLELGWKVSREAVVFVVDHSASLSTARPEIDQWLKQALEERPSTYEAGIVAVGREPMIELTPTLRPVFRGIESAVDANYTNLAGGIRLAFGLFPENTRRRIVIVSDGRENIGNALDEAKALAGRNVRIDVLPIAAESGPDVLVRSLEAPGVLHEGESFGLTAVVESTIETDATLSVYGDRSLISEGTVTLRPGINRFHITTSVGTAGFHSYRAVIRAGGDSQSENNEASAFIRVLGQPTVLVVEGRTAAGANLVSALKARHVATRTVGPAEIPQTLSELRQYASIALCDVSATDIGDRTMEQIEIAVRDLGTGLIMTGGEDSFGPGGYFRTPIERALPVYMDLRAKGELPSLGLVLIVDKSGSMADGAYGVTKVDLAKEAAIRATDVLSGQDRIGVIAFDDASKWVVPMQTVDQVDAIKDAIGTIRAGGGTDIYPALSLAYESLKDSPTKLRHIILMTDGMSATSADYDALISQMKAANITLSAVSVGSDADQALLAHLADAGAGRFYATADYSSIPKIFSKETILATRNYLVNRTFTPAIGTDSPLLRGVAEAGVPALDGYVATSPKPTAELAFVSDNGDPILAGWQYGLGRAVAWTPDLAGRWTGRWAGWNGFGRLLANIVEWTMPATTPDTATVTTSSDGGTCRVTYELAELPGDGAEVSATVVRPDLTATTVPLTAVAPGRYEATFAGDAPGVYLININQTQDGAPAGQTTAGMVVPYSPEYLPVSGDGNLLASVAAAAGGQVITDPADAFAGHAPPVQADMPLWPLLLSLAAILLPLDIASRRLFFSTGDLRELWQRVTARFAVVERPVVTAAMSGLTQMQADRRRTRQRLAERAVMSPTVTGATSPTDAGPALDAAKATPGPQTVEAEPAAKPAAKPPVAPDAGAGDYTGRLLAAKRRTRH